MNFVIRYMMVLIIDSYEVLISKIFHSLHYIFIYGDKKLTVRR